MDKRGIHYFRNDLRVNGNEALFTLIKNVQSVIAVYVVDSMWHKTTKYGCKHLGHHREQFLFESLLDVRKQLATINIPLLVIEDQPVSAICKLIDTCDINTLSFEFHAGLNEQNQIMQIKTNCPKVEFIEGLQNYIFTPQQLPFALSDMPDVFSPFRRKVEKKCKQEIISLKESPFKYEVSSLTSNVTPINANAQLFKHVDISQSKTPKTNEYSGGQTAGMARIQSYFFESNGVAEYKETRNGLDGWSFSSRFSAYLAHGCISPKQIMSALNSFEQTVTKNDSTYWLFFELLWREFFHWQHAKQGLRSFSKQGLRESPAEIPSACKHDETKFQQWKTGETGYDIVDASMKQLAQTGFMSNRARQLAASCFIHELGLDWRYGAAYFEEQLIDFDVASNYGNWQYLAGVGSDPRGLRQFNLDKQTSIYDPNREFINRWL